MGGSGFGGYGSVNPVSTRIDHDESRCCRGKTAGRLVCLASGIMALIVGGAVAGFFVRKHWWEDIKQSEPPTPPAPLGPNSNYTWEYIPSSDNPFMQSLLQIFNNNKLPIQIINFTFTSNVNITDITGLLANPETSKLVAKPMGLVTEYTLMQLAENGFELEANSATNLTITFNKPQGSLPIATLPFDLKLVLKKNGKPVTQLLEYKDTCQTPCKDPGNGKMLGGLVDPHYLDLTRTNVDELHPVPKTMIFTGMVDAVTSGALVPRNIKALATQGPRAQALQRRFSYFQFLLHLGGDDSAQTFWKIFSNSTAETKFLTDAAALYAQISFDGLVIQVDPLYSYPKPYALVAQIMSLHQAFPGKKLYLLVGSDSNQIKAFDPDGTVWKMIDQYTDGILILADKFNHGLPNSGSNLAFDVTTPNGPANATLQMLSALNSKNIANGDFTVVTSLLWEIHDVQSNDGNGYNQPKSGDSRLITQKCSLAGECEGESPPADWRILNSTDTPDANKTLAGWGVSNLGLQAGGGHTYESIKAMVCKLITSGVNGVLFYGLSAAGKYNENLQIASDIMRGSVTCGNPPNGTNSTVVVASDLGVGLDVSRQDGAVAKRAINESSVVSPWLAEQTQQFGQNFGQGELFGAGSFSSIAGEGGKDALFGFVFSVCLTMSSMLLQRAMVGSGVADNTSKYATYFFKALILMMLMDNSDCLATMVAPIATGMACEYFGVSKEKAEDASTVATVAAQALGKVSPESAAMDVANAAVQSVGGFGGSIFGRWTAGQAAGRVAPILSQRERGETTDTEYTERNDTEQAGSAVIWPSNVC